MSKTDDQRPQRESFAEVKACLAECEEIIVGYVFGSTLTSDSPRDLDIAVLFNRDFTGGDVLPAAVALRELIQPPHDVPKTGDKCQDRPRHYVTAGS